MQDLYRSMNRLTTIISDNGREGTLITLSFGLSVVQRTCVMSITHIVIAHCIKRAMAAFDASQELNQCCKMRALIA
jgi:hypothetical protein